MSPFGTRCEPKRSRGSIAAASPLRSAGGFHLGWGAIHRRSGLGLRHRCNDGLRSRLRPCRAAILLEAGSAQYWPSLRRTEWHRRLLPAYRAVRPGLCPHAGPAASLQLARLTALGIVVKLLIVKKQLLTGGEDKILPAIHAFEYLVLEFHDPVVAAALPGRQFPPSSKIEPNLPGARPPKRLTNFNCNDLRGRDEWRRGTESVVPSVEPETPRARDCLMRICGPGGTAV